MTPASRHPPRSPVPRLFPALAGLLLAFPPAPVFSAEEESSHFLIELSSPSTDQEAIFLNLSSATLTPDSLELQIGFRNLGAELFPSYGVLTAQDYTLIDHDSLDSLSAKDFSPKLSLVSPLDGIPPRLANHGSVTFPRPDSVDHLELHVSGFGHVAFSLLPSRIFKPLERTEKIEIAPDKKLLSQHQDLSLFPIHVSAVRLTEKDVVVDLAFENSSNRSLYVKSTGLTGSDAYLVDANFQMYRPKAVSQSLRKSIGPSNTRWGPGIRVPGSLTFPRPPSHSLRKILLSFPTYESLVLTLDHKSRTYLSQVIPAVALKTENPAPHPLRVSADLYHRLSATLNSLSKALQQNDTTAYLARFAENSPARAAQVKFLAALKDVSIEDPHFGLVQEQTFDFDSDGRVNNVNLFLQFSLPDIPEDNPFRSFITCSFRHDAQSNEWLVERWDFQKQIPFWMLGFTEKTSSEHFVIYHRPGAADSSRVSLSQLQLENAYALLAPNTHLQLGKKYVAFLVDREKDFLALTGMDALRYHGVSSSTYTVKENRFTVLNRAMFINDFSFLISPKAKIEAERQKTITHELVHLALTPHTRHFTPPWLIEGAAIYLAGQLNSGSRRALLQSGGLHTLSLSALSRGNLPASNLTSQAALNFEYIYAGEAVAYLIRTFGEEKFYEFYRAFAGYSPVDLEKIALDQAQDDPASKPSIPKMMHKITLDLTERHYGFSLYDIDRAIRSKIEIQSR